MISFHALLASARAELPRATLARWASIFFSLSVLTFLISLAASQAFLAAAGLSYVVHLLRARPSIHFPPIKLPLAVFSLGTVFSVLCSVNPAAGGFAVRKLVLFAILLLGVNLIATGRHLKFLYLGLFAESAVAGLVAAGQFIIQYRTARALYPDRIYTFMTSDRVTGFMGHWMNFGGQQMLVFAALLAFLLLASGIRVSGFGIRKADTQARPKQTVWWLLLVVIAMSILLNFTRGVWLGCFVGALYLVARWKPRWLWALPVLVLIGYLAAPSMVRRRVAVLRRPSDDPALSIRFEMWQAGLRMIRRHPWTGVGPNNIEQVYTLYLPPGKLPELGFHSHMHNNFLQFGAERGLPTLIGWIWLMGALGWHTWRIRRRLVEWRWVADGALAAWLAMLVEGCFEFNFGTSPVLMLFLFVMTTPFAAQRIEHAAGIESKVEG